MKEERVSASRQYECTSSRYTGDKGELIASVRDALRASKICSYAQGMSLIRAGSQEYRWGIDLREMARIWKAGCIIRARLLDDIMHAYERRPDLPNLLLDAEYQRVITSAEAGWRRVVAMASSLAIPLPAMSASLAYFDAYASANLPQNLTQAQRDYFGAHTYQRADDPSGAFVHTDWQALIAKSSGGKQ
jgi:6-phosphogluconate dehydrogenase